MFLRVEKRAISRCRGRNVSGRVLPRAAKVVRGATGAGARTIGLRVAHRGAMGPRMLVRVTIARRWGISGSGVPSCSGQL